VRSRTEPRKRAAFCHEKAFVRMQLQV